MAAACWARQAPDHCYAYRFTAKDRVIVVGGDCHYCDSLVEAVQSADLFVADVASEAISSMPPLGGSVEERAEVISRHHVLPQDLVRLQVRTGRQDHRDLPRAVLPAW